MYTVSHKNVHTYSFAITAPMEPPFATRSGVSQDWATYQRKMLFRSTKKVNMFSSRDKVSHVKGKYGRIIDCIVCFPHCIFGIHVRVFCSLPHAFFLILRPRLCVFYQVLSNINTNKLLQFQLFVSILNPSLVIHGPWPQHCNPASTNDLLASVNHLFVLFSFGSIVGNGADMIYS